MSVGRSVGRFVSRSVGRSVGKSAGKSAYRSVSRSVGRSAGRSASMSAGRSVCKFASDLCDSASLQVICGILTELTPFACFCVILRVSVQITVHCMVSHRYVNLHTFTLFWYVFVQS